MESGPSVQRSSPVRDVICAHHAARHIHGAVIGDGRTCDHQIADNRGRGSHFVVAAKLRAVDHAAREIHCAVRAEIGARFAGLAIERDQARVDGPFEDAQLARRVRPARLRVDPRGHAARADFGIIVRAIHVGIELPLFGAGGGVERDDGD